MRKIVLALSMVFVFAAFTNIDNQKIVLKDIDGTLLQSYAVIDKEQNTITFTVDANTTVSSSVIDGEFKIFLVENGTSNESTEHILNVDGNGSLSFDHYFESNLDVASTTNYLSNAKLVLAGKPKTIQEENNEHL